MPIVAKASASNFVPAPSGSWAAVCCDIVDLGELEVSFGGKKKKQHKINIIWQLGELRNDGKPYIVRKRYTLSLHEKSSLRKDLESWRGRKFSDEELKGFDLEKLLSVPCFLNVIQEEKEGGTYANVTAIMKLPKGMEPVQVRDYVRVCERPPEDGSAVSTDSAEPPANEWDRYHGIDDSDVPF